jgi:hypothetical protein
MRRHMLALSATLVVAGLISLISLFLMSEVSPAVSQETESSVSQGSISEGPGFLEEDFPSYSQVVDDADFGFSAPGWESKSTNPDGYKVDYHVPGAGAGLAQFNVEIPATDVYTVYAWWPTSADNSAAASFGVNTTAGVEWTDPPVNQQQDSGMWIRLGSYQMAAGSSYVQVSPESGGGGRVVADAVAVVRGTVAAPPDDGMIELAGRKATGKDIVRAARKHIGTKYRLSPPGPCQAFKAEDCSCHTKLVFKKFGWSIPDWPKKQWTYGRKIAKSDLRPGDLVFFKEKGRKRPITHVGIYSGNGELVHASRYYGKVTESKMKYIHGYHGARRLNPR